MTAPFSHALGQARTGVDSDYVVRIGSSNAWWPGQGVLSWLLTMGHLAIENETHSLQLHLLLFSLWVKGIHVYLTSWLCNWVCMCAWTGLRDRCAQEVMWGGSRGCTIGLWIQVYRKTWLSFSFESTFNSRSKSWMKNYAFLPTEVQSTLISRIILAASFISIRIRFSILSLFCDRLVIWPRGPI